MPYYDTIEEDLQRAKAILEKGRGEVVGLLSDTGINPIAGGTIYGADTYAAYKLLESFVAEIEQLEREVARLTEAMAAHHAVEQAAILRARSAEAALRKFVDGDFKLIEPKET
jgi:hypothetical protein